MSPLCDSVQITLQIAVSFVVCLDSKKAEKVVSSFHQIAVDNNTLISIPLADLGISKFPHSPPSPSHSLLPPKHTRTHTLSLSLSPSPSGEKNTAYA